MSGSVRSPQFCCSKCDYSTDNKQNFAKHQARKIPCNASDKGSNTCVCDKCGDPFASAGVLARHRLKCSGVGSLRCPTCWRDFKHQTNKCRHEKSGKCSIDMRPATTTTNTINPTSVTLAGTGNTNTSTVNNVNISISCTPTQKDEILSFIDTDLDAVVQLVVKDPARFQLALQHGTLHQELCKATHFGDIAQNRNILGIQEKGKSMRVMHNGKQCVMDKKVGISRIMSNNHKITTDDKTAGYFGKEPIKKSDRVKQQLSWTVQNKGEYVPSRHFYEDVPGAPPSQNQQAEMIDDFLEQLLRYHELGEYGLIVPFGVRSFAHCLQFKSNNWWHAIADAAPDGGQWMIGKDPLDIVTDCVLSFLDLVKTDVHAKMAAPGADTFHLRYAVEALGCLSPSEFIDHVKTYAMA